MFGWFKKRSDPLEALKESLGNYTLPSFPAVVMQAMSELRNRETPLATIAATISTDPGVTAKILSTANSAGFGLRREVQNLDHAVALLGRNNIESLLLAFAVNAQSPKVLHPLFDRNLFWKRAARRAVLAKKIAAVESPAAQSENFTAGLLQDMAIPFLLTAHGEKYSKVLFSNSDTTTLSQRESDAFGWTHADIAELMCQSWEFPQSISRLIALHHNASGDDDVSLSIIIASSWYAEPEEDTESCPASIDPEARQKLHSAFAIDEAALALLCHESTEQADVIAASLLKG